MLCSQATATLQSGKVIKVLGLIKLLRTCLQKSIVPVHDKFIFKVNISRADLLIR